jgi:hypothetical protein
MGAIDGRSQFGHCIRFTAMLSIGFGAWIRLLMGRFWRNSADLMIIESKWSSQDANTSYFFATRNDQEAL